MRAVAEAHIVALRTLWLESVRRQIKAFVAIGTGQHQQLALPCVDRLPGKHQRLRGKSPCVLNRRAITLDLGNKFPHRFEPC